MRCPVCSNEMVQEKKEREEYKRLKEKFKRGIIWSLGILSHD